MSVFNFLRLLFNTIVSILAATTSDIASGSDRCFLPTTPADVTFSIWGFLYAQTVFHLWTLRNDKDFLQATQASTAWVNVFARNDINTSQAELETVFLRLTVSVATQCGNAPASGVCCFLQQYATWAYSAFTQTTQMLEKVYGESCDSAEGQINAVMAEELQARWVDELTAFVKADPINSSELAYNVLFHAAAGICESCKKNDGPVTYTFVANCTTICEASQGRPYGTYGFHFNACFDIP
mmetsp:Transcript_11822/g.19915  ORF Transcript_11822/g.19915 Transcript_11822/m.19915 type:complete len:240 (+) Transcript_11822:80-799(+)|eukprot:CAMPEP_0119313450 /NCGR_PEP_ID=MMETSP1333-20130426/29144_1 /TAXON_ID=418940 /ORGANISM="Scyphosphaera apsteinii, Strain RCC1455" /LENGTH=239 /DNA_ID=CAMNT_0007318289 /DNA_START=78 /DNA_END=797 /DNA_ORIENTATION=+